jgi:hypothetical protein
MKRIPAILSSALRCVALSALNGHAAELRLSSPDGEMDVVISDDAAQLQAPLKFLGRGKWTLRSFSDKPDSSDYRAVIEFRQDVNGKSAFTLSLGPAGALRES